MFELKDNINSESMQNLGDIQRFSNNHLFKDMRRPSSESSPLASSENSLWTSAGSSPSPESSFMTSLGSPPLTSAKSSPLTSVESSPLTSSRSPPLTTSDVPFQKSSVTKCSCAYVLSSDLSFINLSTTCCSVNAVQTSPLCRCSTRQNTSLSRSEDCRISFTPSHCCSRSVPSKCSEFPESIQDDFGFFLAKTKTNFSCVRLIYVSIFLSILEVSWSLRTGRYAPYDSLCRGATSPRIPVMWDCTGFVQCTPIEDGQFQAVWTRCTDGRLFNPSQSACVPSYDRCLDPKDVAMNICPSMPHIRFPHPASCALFYDCSQRNTRKFLARWENECPDPLMFDEGTFTCVEKNGRNGEICGNRPEPNGKCDYRLGCRDRNCTGLDDGPHYDPLFPFSEHFYVCSNGTVKEKKTCQEDGAHFDPKTRDCTENIYEDSVREFCVKNPRAKFADPTRCSLYYDCSQASWNSKLKPYQNECSYPRMYNANSSSCASFHDVKCGNRPETVQPCDYVVGHCTGSGCMPCHASCAGLRDGANAYPGQVLTGFYLVCQQNRTLDIRRCADGYIFDPQMRFCLNEISPQTLDMYCVNNPNGRLLHPGECSIFYSCAQPNNTQMNPNLPPRAVECKYPFLVDAGTKTCKSHTLVNCGHRREPFSPCDYVSNRCTSKACTRCELVMPSCYGKADNFYPAINQEMTSKYIVCKDQRVYNSGECLHGHIFDIRTLTCTDTVYPVSLIEYCTNYPTGRVQNPTNCAKYYDCAISKPHITECTYPDLYDTLSHLCLPYEQVNCAGRPVFLDPCDSFTFCPIQPCPYCKSAYPSCVGRNGVVDWFNFEPSMYYECKDDRMKVKYCQTTFNYTAQTCNELISPVPQVPGIPTTTRQPDTTFGGTDSPANIRLTCQLNPAHIMSKNDNCAQFYNCSRATSPLGDYISECPVGMLFHPGTKQCLPYIEVLCQGRYEPKQVCDYENMCLSTKTSTGCLDCLETYPSCLATPNGNVPFKGSFSHGAVQCRSGRVVKITTCPVGYFYDNIRRICTNVLNNDTVQYACMDRPNQLLAHPLFCAKFIKCGQQSTTGRLDDVSFSVGECSYPLLFTNGLCNSYTTAQCRRRSEAIVPCDYEELRKCPGNVSRCNVESADTCPDRQEHTCQSCEERYPSCLNSLNGLVHYPRRLFTPDFIRCDQNRTLAILKCVGSVFDPDGRSCGLNLNTVVTFAHRDPVSFCDRYPTAIIPHPNHCARFYNCSAAVNQGVGGVPHLEECPHPQLFDTNLRRCQKFIEVLHTSGCASKLQPKHYCDYLSYCPSQRFKTCEDCRRALPSCENKANGIHGNPPGNAVTRGFMYCLEGRVEATSNCPLGSMFHESAKSCVRQTSSGRR